MKNRYRVVIDTNLIISAALNKQSTPRRVIELIFRHHILLASLATLFEARQKLTLPKFNRYVSISERQHFHERFFSFATFVNVTSIITDCRDPKDNKFLELAVDGKADYIVTGDNDLLVLNPFQKIPILTAREFLDV